MSGEGFIPIVEIEAYCRITGVEEGEERIDFMRAIRAMDAAFLAERREKAEGKGSKQAETP